ncbi:hypothetical protein WN48_07833 [Eufriesea mexicana]|uniref:THAP-type domain-containing protein n=1 Tax=Eufriesea mexicana TaxID=516756 RepID=A0A310SF90_9HYME|nr:PREDICTED: uncharacterized protein LOC108545525 [Eufriesea mexicana]XP_017752683.1 PREDICTED: uncharacterized protein LOC108545525 [Eufriesea mexicana]OAD59988.1 hypothetical protein WN48_07833 [Eufriesea mexicana]
MTRKCVLCKETNYRNTYSFFSAPKDPETRKKWQNAIAIENYAVTDDTYVCSKHFHKDDIITHWVSGVPPHVITIKYKKCRLRPGAVPGKSYHLKENIRVQENLDDPDSSINKFDKINTIKEEETDFLIPRTEKRLQINNDESYKITSLHYQFSQDFNGYNYNSMENSLNKIKFSENGSNVNNIYYVGPQIKESSEYNLNQMKQNKSINLMEKNVISNINLIENKDRKEKQNQIPKEDFYCNTSKKVLESSSKNYIFDGHETMVWKHKTVKKDIPKEELIDNNFKATENVYIKNQIVHNLNYNQLDTYYPMFNEINENEMLFEDLLEVCTEVLLPRGWSCLVTSKGHTTTIVYLYMGMTKSGMPFTEKQVFIKSDLMLHCAVENREINPLIHNLIREGKHLKIQNLLDIEEVIDEFNQRTICQGIYTTERFQNINRIIVAYKDGIKWRHVLCPLIVNNDSLRCTKCISLSHTLRYKSKNLIFPHNSSILKKQQQNVDSIHQRYKRVRRQDHGYGFIKVFKQ